MAISGTTPDPPATSSTARPGPAPRRSSRPPALELQLVALAELAGQVRRDLAVLQALHGQLDPRAVGAEAIE